MMKLNDWVNELRIYLLCVIIQSLGCFNNSNQQKQRQDKGYMKERIEGEEGIRSEMRNANHQMVEDYKRLYFEAIERLHQLTSIENTIGQTNDMLAQLQANQVVKGQSQRIKQLEQELSYKTTQLQSSVIQLKRVTLLNEQKQSHLSKKVQTEVKKNLLASEELLLLKNQIRLLTKQLDNSREVTKHYQRRIKLYECHNTITNDENQQTHNSSPELVEAIHRQHQQIAIYQRQLKDLQAESANSEHKLTKLQQHLRETQELHQLELTAKQSIIANLTQQLTKKSSAINQLSRELQALTDHMKGQPKVTDVQVGSYREGGDIQTKRLRDMLQQYAYMVESYEIKQQQLYDQLLAKDQLLEELQHQNAQYSQEVHQLKCALSGLKSDFIHSELTRPSLSSKRSTPKHGQSTPKQEQSALQLSRISQIHYQTQKALDQSRSTYNNSHNLSLSRLNSSAFTDSTLPFTPVNSLRNSRKMCHTNNNSNNMKQKAQVSTCSSKNSPYNMNSDKCKSFYKHNKLQLRNQEVTPFGE